MFTIILTNALFFTQRGVCFAIGRHVERAEQHHRPPLERRVRGRGHRRRPLPGHDVHRPPTALPERPGGEDARAARRGRRRRGVRGVPGAEGRAHREAARRVVHRHVRQHVLVGGAVRARGGVRERGPRDRRGEEPGARRGRGPRAAELRRPRRRDPAGVQPAGARRERRAARGGAAAHRAHGLRVGPRARPHPQAGLVHDERERRARPGTSVRRHANQRGPCLV